MNQNTRITVTVALIVAPGGVLVRFGAAVISVLIGFTGGQFGLVKNELGWAGS